VRKSISVIDHRLLHDARPMKVNVLNALHCISESWCCVIHTTILKHFQKCDFNVNEISDGEDATELYLAKGDWS
jgi:hypothetical protein